MASLVSDNAIGWGQFQLNGGWKNTLSVAGAYGIILAGLVYLTASIDPRQASFVNSLWTKGLVGIQFALLVLYGTNRIIGGIRRDVGSQLIESHRLMPITPFEAVLGYVFGGASQTISLQIVNLIIGAITARNAGLPFRYWVYVNLILATFALFIWSIVTVSAMTARGALIWVIGPLLLYWVSWGTISILLPVFAVLATPLQDMTVFDARVMNRPPALYAGPLLCQAAIIVICIAGAMRKYRRSEDAAFSPTLALMLLAAIVGACVIGIRNFDEVRSRFVQESVDRDIQLVASAIVVMWLNAMVMCSLAWSDALHKRGEGRREPPRHHAFPPLLGAVLAAGIGSCVALAYGHTMDDRRQMLLYIGGIMLAQGIGLVSLARWVYARVDRAIVIVVIWLFLTTLVPLVIDVMIRSLQDIDRPMGTVATFSPIGCLIAVMNDHPKEADPRIGLAGQFGIALLPVLLYYAERLRTKHRRKLHGFEVVPAKA